MQKIIKYLKHLVIRFFADEIDFEVARQVKGLNERVKKFMGPLSVLEHALSGRNGLVLYHIGGQYVGQVFAEMNIEEELKKWNVLKIVRSNSLKDIFENTPTNSNSQLAQMCSTGDLSIAPDVPEEVAQTFIDALAGKYG